MSCATSRSPSIVDMVSRMSGCVMLSKLECELRFLCPKISIKYAAFFNSFSMENRCQTVSALGRDKPHRSTPSIMHSGIMRPSVLNTRTSTCEPWSYLMQLGLHNLLWTGYDVIVPPPLNGSFFFFCKRLSLRR